MISRVGGCQPEGSLQESYSGFQLVVPHGNEGELEVCLMKVWSRFQKLAAEQFRSAPMTSIQHVLGLYESLLRRHEIRELQ